MVKAKKYVLIKYFEGEPKATDLKFVEEELPPLQNEEFLVKAEYLSVDPYMRPYTQNFPLGTTMIGSQVARIMESKHPDFPVGKRVIGYLGWRDYTIVGPSNFSKVSQNTLLPVGRIDILPDIGDLSPSLALGALGMPGITAYFGLMEICKPKPGETIVISGAAGAVGSHVGQIAKNLGLTVIGICGSDEKCKWLTDELGFDVAINYKTKSIAKKGFVVSQWMDRWTEGIQQNLQWIREDKLRYRETVTKGFENMFDAFIGMLRGGNIGKAIVQV
ncbi:hypothetical protein DMN91_003826 [Ooceraea biroi]|uniref:15-oxoprostaglandin 13-reductase n=1 Tax=Ooceraea biroi TaxID=2015173 RepID=A0A3L8DT60_OOCBI|nr:hypothetical protein DMN91_003826 [Ooceraea biroi]